MTAGHLVGFSSNFAPLWPVFRLILLVHDPPPVASMMASIMESSPTAHISPRTDADWQAWRETFTHLYMDENHPLPKVMDIMKEKYHFVAR
jgi:hypothetical protein